MDNMQLYNSVRAVPEGALKKIEAGRLRGKSDINPMWRLKVLTETFGICGFGWKYEITKQWIETGGNSEIAAFVNINLYIKINDVWSEAIPGTGGSSFVANEKNGPYTSDECFKMALTDAISVACKALGVGADVYWDKDQTKYVPQTTAKQQEKLSPEQLKRFFAIKSKAGATDDQAKKIISNKIKKSIKDATAEEYKVICNLFESGEWRKELEEANVKPN